MRNRRRGITLIELTMMIAIGAIIFTGISKSAQSLMKGALDNRNYLVALNLAKRQMAIMNNAAYPTVAAEASVGADAAFPDFIPTQEVVNIVTNGSDTLNEIRVRVHYQTAAGPVLILLRTYRSNVITFGNGT